MATVPAVLSSSLDGEKGYHLKYQTRLLSSKLPQPCQLHLRYLFPPDVYVDPYELEDQLPHSFSVNDTINLESPVGTAMTRSWTELQVSLGEVPEDESVLLTVPIHSRYGMPGDAGHHQVSLPQASGIWSCSETGSSILFDNVAIPSGSDTLVFRVPLGSPSHLNHIELGTVAVVTATFLYLLSVFYTTTQRLYASKVESKSN